MRYTGHSWSNVLHADHHNSHLNPSFASLPEGVVRNDAWWIIGLCGATLLHNPGRWGLAQIHLNQLELRFPESGLYPQLSILEISPILSYALKCIYQL